MLSFSFWYANAQSDTAKGKLIVTPSGFADVYYAWDFNRPSEPKRQDFLYNHNRHNQFNLNLGMIKVALTHPWFSVNLAIHAGTYMNDNYVQEKGLLKHLFEANASVSLNRKHTLRIDGGIFASHIGFESAISAENWTLTRSLLAENSPYYLTGAKLSYKSSKIEVAALVLNGWQHIVPVQGNSLPAFGTQLLYKPNDQYSFNWSTFVGSENPDATRTIRFFNNLYALFNFTERWGLITGFDIGIEQVSKGSSKMNYWLSPVLIARCAVNSKFALAVRGEYYLDKNGVIISTTSPHGFGVVGLSLNTDYQVLPFMLIRVEGRWLNSRDNLFTHPSGLARNNAFIVSSIAFTLNKATLYDKMLSRAAE